MKIQCSYCANTHTDPDEHDSCELNYYRRLIAGGYKEGVLAERAEIRKLVEKSQHNWRHHCTSVDDCVACMLHKELLLAIDARDGDKK